MTHAAPPPPPNPGRVQSPSRGDRIVDWACLLVVLSALVAFVLVALGGQR